MDSVVNLCRSKMPRGHFRRASIVLACAVLLSLGACGEGGPRDTDETMMNSAAGTAQVANIVDQRQGPLKPVRWGVWRRKDQSIELGALVPYCGYGRPKPYVERVARRHGLGGVVLTMFVRFTPQRVGPDAGGCVFVQVGISQWVRLGRRATQVRLYDGSTFPPTRRRLH